MLFIDLVHYAACSALFVQPEAVCFQNSFSSQTERKQMVVECRPASSAQLSLFCSKHKNLCLVDEGLRLQPDVRRI